MKNYIQAGKTINYTVATTLIASGEARKVGSLFGIALKDAAIGEVCPMDTEGCFEIPKDVSVVTGLGHLLYWDDTAKKATITAASNIKIGYALEAAATGVATVKAKIFPSI
jgi:predicted RecA/RadA family phage recombinase